MAGLSLGGFQTFMIGINHPELFFSYGFFSAAIIGNITSDPKSMTAAIDWAIAQNSQVGSPLFDKIEVSKVAAMGQSCGGLMALMQRTTADQSST